MIIKTPLRLSLVGGGSDLSYFYEKNEGSSLGFPINFFNYIYISKLEQKLIHFVSDKENIETNNVRTIKNDILRNVLTKFKVNQKKIFIFSDLAYGTGLGSSSAMTVGLIRAINKFEDLGLKNNQLANEAYKVEKKATGSTIGKQDHYMSTFGGINLFKYKTDNTTKVEKIKISDRKIANLEKHILLIRVGGVRNASEILHDQKNNLIYNETKFQNMKRLTGFVSLVKNAILNSDYKEVGKLISETWEIKKSFSKHISNPEIDKLYKYLLDIGIYGGKLLGAGQSGFFMAICNPKVSSKIFKCIPSNKIIKVKLEKQGSRIILD